MSGSAPVPADPSETNRQPASAGGDRDASSLHRPPISIGWAIVGSLAIAAGLELSGRFLFQAYGVGYGVTGMLTLLAMAVWAGSAVYVIRRAHGVPRVTWTLSIGACLIVFSQAVSMGQYFALPGVTFLMRTAQPLLVALEDEGFVAGLALVFAGFYLSIIEAARSNARLKRERQALAEEVAEHARAEEALGKAYADTELRVQERTASLQDLNQRLLDEIAQRAEFERALQASETRYRSLAEASRDVILIVNRDDTVAYVNSFAGKQLGLPQEDIIGRKRSDLFPPEIDLDQRRNLGRVFETGEPLRVENRARLQNREGWQDTHLIPLKDRNGNVTAVLGISRDITERKHAELALRESEERHRSLIEGLSEAVYRMTLPDGKYEYMGPNAEFVFGYSAEHFMSNPKCIYEIIHPASAAYLDEMWGRLIQGEMLSTYEYRIIDPKGKERWILQSNTLIRNESGVPVAIEGICRNNTEEKRANQLIEEQRAKFLDSAKMSVLGEMASNVAHEINNPLAIVSGSAEQLRNLLDRDPVLMEYVPRLTDTIMRNVSRIQTIVNGLRTFAREGEHDPFVSTPLRSIVDDAVVLCQDRFVSHHVALTVEEIPENLSVECRATQIMEVLFNLLSNALHAVEGGDDKWVTISVTDAGDEMALSVTDSGPGVRPEVAKLLFDRFVTSKEFGKGMGLGLSISKRIVLAHNGALSLDTTCPNTRFIVRLPKRQAPHTAPEE